MPSNPLCGLQALCLKLNLSLIYKLAELCFFTNNLFAGAVK